MADRSPLKLALFAVGATLGFLSIFLVITAIVVAGWTAFQVSQFTQAAQTTPAQLLTLATVGLNTSPVQTDGKKNILILGIDSLATRGNAPALTDTMILLSLDMKTGAISSLSFPRDLWLDDLKTRVNALYFYGIERYPDQPERFPTEVFAQLTGVPIHHTIVVSLDDLGQLIDLVGGVRIDVQSGFVDDQFPRTDVDVTVERDPAKLYERIEFTTGEHTFDGPTALKYIRSRHAEGDQGTDDARSARQQQVIEALLSKTTQPSLWLNPTRAGTMYRFYADHFADDFSMIEAIATARTLLPHRQQLGFSGQGLSIYPTDPAGVITHPPVQAYQGQWVYVIREVDEFQREVKQKLHLQPIQ